MSRTRFAIAAAALALMSASASAQVSYESRGYGGPLGIGPNFQQGGQHSPPVYGGQERSTERYRAPQRLDRVQRKRNTDDDDVKSAKKTPAAEEPKEATARNENSSIVSIASEKDKTLRAPAVTEQKQTDVAKSEKSKSSNENSAIASVSSSATAKADPVKAEVTKADTDGSGKPTGCKRYFPTVGQTITVPCD